MAVAGILAMLIIFTTGLGCIFASIIGLILCRVYEKHCGIKCKLFIKIILWILLAVGIAAVCYSAPFLHYIFSQLFSYYLCKRQ